MTSTYFRISAAALICATVLAVVATPARAEHGDWTLGSFGLEGASQPAEGLYYLNQWSYYHASGSFFSSIGRIKCGPLGRACLGLNLNIGGSGNLDLFIDQNIFGWTSPYKILGANYGLFVDIPFVYADASGAASLQPILSFQRGTLTGPINQQSNESTKGSLSAIYLEPINLGWHFQHLDAIVSSGVIMPSGGYDPSAQLNTGPGNAAGVFGLGAVLYPDVEHTWSLSIYTHYLLYASQLGRPYRLGDVVPFEWGAGKTLNINSQFLKQITIGAVGLFSVSYYEEFGAHATPSGRQLMFSVAF